MNNMAAKRKRRFPVLGRREMALFLLTCSCGVLLFSVPPRSEVLRPVSARAREESKPRVESETIFDTPLPTTGCGRIPLIAAGTSGGGTLASGGLMRTYWLHIPRSYEPNHLYPLVLNFHGHGSSAVHQELISGFSRLADRLGFIVVYPQGAIGPQNETGWASGGANQPDTNDVLFVSNLLNTLQSEVCIDPTRIYATGFSNGGGLTSILACTMAHRIAAFAPVSGSYYPLASGCDPDRAVPILEFHGTADRTVPYSGRSKLNELGTLAWLKSWAERNDCASMPNEFLSTKTVTGLEWRGCVNDAVVIHYRLNGGVHVWPDQSGDPRLPVADQSLDTTLVIWQFFMMHPLPGKVKVIDS
jgi:polyhydroxybutyrate depolymerase